MNESQNTQMETVLHKTLFYSLSRVLSFLALFWADLILFNDLPPADYANYVVFKNFTILFRVFALFEIQTAVVKLWRSGADWQNAAMIRACTIVLVVFQACTIVAIGIFVSQSFTNLKSLGVEALLIFLALIVTLVTDVGYRFFEAILFCYQSYLRLSIVNLVMGAAFFLFVVVGLLTYGFNVSAAMTAYVLMYVTTFVTSGALLTYRVIAARRRERAGTRAPSKASAEHDARCQEASEQGSSEKTRPPAPSTADRAKGRATPETPSEDPEAFKTVLKRLAKFSLPLYLATIFYFFYFNVNVIFLNNLATKEAVSYYSFSKDFISNTLTFLGMVIGMSLYPFITAAVEADDQEQVGKLLTFTKTTYLVVILPMLLLFVIFTRDIFTLLRLTHQDDDLLYITFKLLIIGGFFISLANLTRHYILATGRTKVFLAMELAGAAVNLVIVTALIQTLGIYAAIWGFNLSTAVIEGFHLYKFHKLYPEHRFTRTILEVIGIYVVLGVWHWYLEKVIVNWAVMVILVMGPYFLLVFGLKLVRVDELKPYLRSIMSPRKILSTFKKGAPASEK